MSPIKPTFSSFKPHTFPFSLSQQTQIQQSISQQQTQIQQIYQSSEKKMKLVWSPETATKAYIDTIKYCKNVDQQSSSVPELISAMAAGWKAKLIVETWPAQDGVITTSIGLAIASRHTGGRHICIVPNQRTKSDYVEAMREINMVVPEIIVGEAEQVIEKIDGIDLLVVDCRQKEFYKVLRVAKLGNKGAVLVCKHASLRNGLNFRWRSVVDGCDHRRMVRSVFIPVGKGLDIAHVATSGELKGESRWIKHVDRESGEEHVIRR